MIEFYFPAPMILESKIEEFENIIGKQLPNNYRKYLIDKGAGGTPIPDLVFKITKAGEIVNAEFVDEVMLGYLLSTDESSPTNLIDYYQTRNSSERELPYLPSDLISIGGDPGSGLILIGIAEKKKEKYSIGMQTYLIEMKMMIQHMATSHL
jgi:hypothetical protein